MIFQDVINLIMRIVYDGHIRPVDGIIFTKYIRYYS